MTAPTLDRRWSLDELRKAPYKWLAGQMALSLILFVSAGASAQVGTPVPPPPVKMMVAQASSSPGWNELRPAQRDILQPLAPSWPSLSQSHKRKWLEMTKSYPALPVDEQAKIQSRMKEWVALTPQQRTQARLNFAKTNELSKELTAEEKKAKWDAYQSLSNEEKRKLADKAPPKPGGAALASRPVSRQKLATLPSVADQAKANAAPRIGLPQPIDHPTGTAPTASPAVVPGVPLGQTH